MSKMYWLFGVGILSTYLITESRGFVYFEPGAKKRVPAEARSSRGYRSHSFWYVGYYGGK